RLAPDAERSRLDSFSPPVPAARRARRERRSQRRPRWNGPWKRLAQRPPSSPDLPQLCCRILVALLHPPRPPARSRPGPPRRNLLFIHGIARTSSGNPCGGIRPVGQTLGRRRGPCPLE